MGWEHPARGAFAITPNDSANLSKLTRAVYVGGAGNLHVIMEDGSEVTFNGLTAGSVYPICARKVFSTATTATNLVGMY